MSSTSGAVSVASQTWRVLSGPSLAAIISQPGNVPVSCRFFLCIFRRE